MGAFSRDEPNSDLNELVQPSLDRVGRLLVRRQGEDPLRLCIILTRAHGFTPNGAIAVGAGGEGIEDGAHVDELIVATLIEAAENYAAGAGIPIRVIRPQDN